MCFYLYFNFIKIKYKAKIAVIEFAKITDKLFI